MQRRRRNRVMMRLIAINLLLLIVAVSGFSQQRTRRPVCRNEVFAALNPLPELTYECPTDALTESDSRILTTPDRIAAIKNVIKELESFSDPRWWQAEVDELNACYLRERPGALTAEERDQFTDEEYQVRLMGNHQIRVVVTPDPCYQTYYNGANVYLLYRQGAKIHVTEVLNGYYSRLAKSLSVRITGPASEPLIEIKTVNIWAMRPEYTSDYFVIDKTTKKAVEKKFGSRRPAKR